MTIDEASDPFEAAPANDDGGAVADELESIESSPLDERATRYQGLVDRLREALEQSDPSGDR